MEKEPLSVIDNVILFAKGPYTTEIRRGSLVCLFTIIYKTYINEVLYSIQNKQSM